MGGMKAAGRSTGMQDVARRLRTGLFDLVKFAWHAIVRFIADGCLTGAGALSYTTLVSLVPLIAVALAILSAFPSFEEARNRLIVLVFHNLVPASVGEEAEWWFRYFAGGAAQTTAIGVVALAATAILLLVTIEDQLHVIWRVTNRRPWVQRVLVYWTILTLGPLLLATSLSLSGYFDVLARTLSIDAAAVERVTEAWFHDIARIMPFVLEAAALTLLYCLVPNTTVRWREGAAGAVVAAGAIEALKVGFAIYITRFSSYRTIYGALAAIPIFLLWMYVSWAIVLFGAVIAAALPKWRVDEGIPQVTTDERRLGLAVAILAELSERARHGGTLGTVELATHLCVAAAAAEEHLGLLRQAGFVAATTDGGWVLARRLASASLHDLYRAMKIPLAGTWRETEAEAAWQHRVAGAMQRVTAAEAGALRIPLAGIVDEVLADTAAAAAAEEGVTTPLKTKSGGGRGDFRR